MASLTGATFLPFLPLPMAVMRGPSPDVVTGMAPAKSSVGCSPSSLAWPSQRGDRDLAHGLPLAVRSMLLRLGPGRYVFPLPGRTCGGRACRALTAARRCAGSSLLVFDG